MYHTLEALEKPRVSAENLFDTVRRYGAAKCIKKRREREREECCIRAVRLPVSDSSLLIRSTAT